MLRLRDRAGRDRLRLLVDPQGVAKLEFLDEQGKVADCTVIEPSGVASLDAQSCAVIKQGAKYKPAIGLDGKRAKSAAFQSITWKMF